MFKCFQKFFLVICLSAAFFSGAVSAQDQLTIGFTGRQISSDTVGYSFSFSIHQAGIDVLELSSSHDLITVHSAGQKTVLYREDARIYSRGYTSTSPFSVEQESLVQFPENSVFLPENRFGENILCYSSFYTESRVTQDFHCFALDQEKGAFSQYLFFEKGNPTASFEKSITPISVSPTLVEFGFPKTFLEAGMGLQPAKMVYLKKVSSKKMEVGIAEKIGIFDISGKGYKPKISKRTKVVLKPKEFPTTINLDGVEIEFLSFENNQISYRVNSGFNSWATIIDGGNGISVRESEG